MAFVFGHGGAVGLCVSFHRSMDLLLLYREIYLAGGFLDHKFDRLFYDISIWDASS